MKTPLRLIALLFLCLLVPILEAQSFRFALLTDLHVSVHNPNPAADLGAAVREVNGLDSIAFVIVTGDVTEAGDKVAMLMAKAILDSLQVPYYITSGNHETKWSESGVTDFVHVFGADKFSFSYQNCQFIGFNTGPVMKMADGHVAPQDIAWVHAELEKMSKAKPVFICTHYPLQTGDVDNWYDLTDILRQYNVQTILGGHYHRNILFNCDGLPDVLNRSTLRGKKTVGGYSLITVTPEKIVFQEKVIDKQPEQWLELPFGLKEYDAPDSALRPSLEVNTQYPQVHEVWRAEIGVGIYGTPALYKKRVLVGDDNGVMHCLSLKSGKEQWTFRTGSRIVSSPAASDGKVIFGSTDGNIYCLRISDGTELWRVPTEKAVMGCPLICDSVVYIGGSDGCMRALSLQSGRQLWAFCEAKSYIETRPVVYGGNIYFGAWDCNLYALRIADGSLVWQWNNGRSNDKFSPAAVWPIAANGKIFITAPDRYFTALDAETGKAVWRTSQHVVRETVGLSTDGKMVFSRCMNDSVLALDAVGNEPKLLWKINAAYGYDHNPSMLIERDGVVIFGTKNGLLHGLDAYTGKVLWRHKIGNSVLNTIAPISGTECVVSSSEGSVVRIRVKH